MIVEVDEQRSEANDERPMIDEMGESASCASSSARRRIKKDSKLS